jgi:FixJ family two-component response regulator
VRRHARTVYVVDDDVSVRRALERLLRATGYRVIACASAAEFLALHEIARPTCLVVDVRMPGQTGFDLQDALRAAGRTEPVVFMTGHGDQAMAARALAAGAVAMLAKPFEDGPLLEAVERALRLDARRDDWADVSGLSH